MTVSFVERVCGAILGTAIGDALGMPAEGLSPEDIKKFYGKITRLVEPVCENSYHKLHKGQWTDDTQLMLAILESIVDKKVIDYDNIAKRHVEALLHSRGWGKATTKAVTRIRDGVPWWNSAEEDAAGNGPPMKIAPIGVLYGLEVIDKAELFSVVTNISRMTHNDPRAIASVMIQAWLIGKALLGGKKLLIHSLQHLISNECWHYEMSFGITDKPLFLKFAGEDFNIVEASHLSSDRIRCKFGTGAFVNRSMPFTYSMLLKYIDDPSKCLTEIVNQGGDCDTNAAMAGSLLGAIYGYNAFDYYFTYCLEKRDEIIKLAEQMYHIFKGV